MKVSFEMSDCYAVFSVSQFHRETDNRNKELTKIDERVYSAMLVRLIV